MSEDNYEYSMTGGTTNNEKKSLEKQVEILQKTVDGLIDRIIQLEEAVFEGG